MGRWYFDRKSTVEESRSVSIAFLGKNGFFCGLRSGTVTWTNSCGEQTASIGIWVSTLHGKNYARFQYTSTDRQTGEKISYDYKVQLVATPCHYGGVRWWFVCPLNKNGIYCGRRVAKLYLVPGSKYFGCRHCHELSYDSRNESRLVRWGQVGYCVKLERQIDELRERMPRWTYRGKPTRKARKLHVLEARMDECGNTNWERLLAR
jgi:hypothetical protein